MTRDHTEMKTTDQRNTFTWTLSIYIFFSVAFFPSVSFGLFENTPSLTPDEKNNIEIFKNATHSVVYVTNTALKQDMFSFNVQQIPQGTGSGFVWDTSGIIVTNFHVIRGADIVTITLHDHSSWPAKVLGLAEDKDLDSLEISDEIIDKIVILYSYDFGSDLDVNILGHIFEQSISDIENLTGNNEEKRKKDGVFYTPAYITEYIVKEAVGGWLADRKAEITAKEGSKEWWLEYAEKLKSIKILDPACGSGAFLVKVFDYLQNEWQEVPEEIKTEIKAEIKTETKTNWNYKDILTNNIYGVDINPASVSITKLSLWLKTAHYREPLTTLDNNIKIGNSLIDNPDIAGYYSEFEGKIVQEHIKSEGSLLDFTAIEEIKNEGVKKSLAFKWEKEFKEVFKELEETLASLIMSATSAFGNFLSIAENILETISVSIKPS